MTTLDFGAVFAFEDKSSGATFGVSLATLLQCLCVAQQRYIVPPFDPEWERAAIPPTLMEKSALATPASIEKNQQGAV